MSTALYGIFVILFAHTTATFAQKHSKPRAAWAMFGLTTLSFLLATLYWFAFCVYFLGYVRLGFLNNINGPVDNYWLNSVFQSVFKSYKIKLYAVEVLQVINDAIMIWRVWVLWAGRRWVIMGPVMLLLGMFGNVFTCVVIEGTKQNGGHDFLNVVPLTRALVISGACLSVATNALSIILLGIQLWVHRKAMILSVGNRLRSRSQNVLLLIIESGSVYCALQLAVLIMMGSPALENSPFFGFFEPIAFEFYAQTTGMYPMVVLLLIHQKRSVVDIHIARISVTRDEGTE